MEEYDVMRMRTHCASLFSRYHAKSDLIFTYDVCLVFSQQNAEGGSRSSDYVSDNLEAAWILCKVSSVISS